MWMGVPVIGPCVGVYVSLCVSLGVFRFAVFIVGLVPCAITIMVECQLWGSNPRGVTSSGS